jgi:hypothetical protein
MYCSVWMLYLDDVCKKNVLQFNKICNNSYFYCYDPAASLIEPEYL